MRRQSPLDYFQSINRNIVECKAVQAAEELSPRTSINRNIVECKVQKQKADNRENMVLIETLWNVKMQEK